MIVVMGIFAADLVFQTPRMPAWTETVIGSGFAIGPGGKGSNQAIATARLGAQVQFLAKIGEDDFGRMAKGIYAAEGVGTDYLVTTPDHPTGSAAIIVDQATGENSVLVVPGAAALLTLEEIDRAAPAFTRGGIFVTQLETPMAPVAHALRRAKAAGMTTILNPAPAAEIPDEVLALVDILTPNEPEAAGLAGRPVRSLAEAEAAADALAARGPKAVIVTLGAAGALLRQEWRSTVVPAVTAGPVVDTTGAGDSFNAAVAVALSEGRSLAEAAAFGCVVAGLKVTKQGAGAGMPQRAEVEDFEAKRRV